MKNLFLIFTLLLMPLEPIYARTFHVDVYTEKRLLSYVVEAPTDAMALDSVFIAVVYNKKLPKPISAIVRETDLSTYHLRKTLFRISASRRDYSVILYVSDPSYAMTAIQASRLLMSKTPVTENISLGYNGTKLKDKASAEYIVEFPSQDILFELNVDNVENGKVALDIAARVSPRAPEYLGVKSIMSQCKNLFLN